MLENIIQKYHHGNVQIFYHKRIDNKFPITFTKTYEHSIFDGGKQLQFSYHLQTFARSYHRISEVSFINFFFTDFNKIR